MGIDFYYIPLSPPCRAVMYLAHELGIELNLKFLDLSEGHHLAPEFLKINPSHSVPTIIDDGFILWESRAVMQYLCNKYAPDSELYPKAPKKRAVVDRMLNFDLGSYYTALREAFIPKLFRDTEPTEEALKAIREKLVLIEKFIGDNKYVAGDSFTIADMSLLASSTFITIAGFDISEYPKFKEWYERIPMEHPQIAEINMQALEGAKAFAEKMKKHLSEKK